MLIPFTAQVNLLLSKRESICEGFREAHYALPTLLQVGSSLVNADMENLNDVKEKVLQLVPSMDGRLAFMYAMVMFLSEKVSIYSHTCTS